MFVKRGKERYIIILRLISKVLPGALKFSSAFAVRAFSAVTFPAATSNYSRKLREDSYQIFVPMTFEISSQGK